MVFSLKSQSQLLLVGALKAAAIGWHSRVAAIGWHSRVAAVGWHSRVAAAGWHYQADAISVGALT